MKNASKLIWTVLVLMVLSSGLLTAQEKFGGLTLYTLRDIMRDNPEEILKEVAGIGYKYLEVADYRDGKFYGMEPAEFKSLADELGMVPLSAHMGSVNLENADQQIADVKAAGMKYFVIPVPPMGHFNFDRETQSLSMSEDLETLAEILTTLGKKCNEAGLQLLYHNHDFEFKPNKNGIVPMEYFLENLDPEQVNFQIDLYWAVKAGEDPVAWFEKYPGRFRIWHVKDMDNQGRFAPVGTGTIDFEEILEHKELSGMKYYIVEQDRTFDGMEPLEAVRISHKGLAEFGFN